MTEEELKKIPFRFVCHLNMEHEHCTTYASEDGKFGFCVHQPYKNGAPYGRSYRHWRIGGDVFKSWGKFLERLKDV